MKYFILILLVLLTTACQGSRDDLSESIKVSQPQSGEFVSCPLHVEGEARGNWYFESTFPVQLQDQDGNALLVRTAQAKSDWMTEDFVPFELDLYYRIEEAQKGLLILSRDNPSGLPEYDQQLEIPVQLTPCDTDVFQTYQKGIVENYIRENIGTISPAEPVLGGTWYVVSIDFSNENHVSVTYEDGHIQETFEADYEVDMWGNILLSFTR